MEWRPAGGIDVMSNILLGVPPRDMVLVMLTSEFPSHCSLSHGDQWQIEYQKVLMVEYFSVSSKTAELPPLAEVAEQAGKRKQGYEKKCARESGPPRCLLLVCWWCLSDHVSQVLHWLTRVAPPLQPAGFGEVRALVWTNVPGEVPLQFDSSG